MVVSLPSASVPTRHPRVALGIPRKGTGPRRKHGPGGAHCSADPGVPADAPGHGFWEPQGDSEVCVCHRGTETPTKKEKEKDKKKEKKIPFTAVSLLDVQICN